MTVALRTPRLLLRAWRDDDIAPRAEIVAFTVPANLQSRRLMERLGMTRDRHGDFDHPAFPPGHPLCRHVLYRLRRENR